MTFPAFQTSLRRLLVILSIFVLAPTAIFWIMTTQPIFPTSPQIDSKKVNPKALEAHVRMLSETFAPRNDYHPAQLDHTADYILKEFEKAGGRVSEQVFKVDGHIYRNVIAHFGPETRERIVVGGHYDAYGEFPGADDNASAIAGLIELAYLLKKTSLTTLVELVAFALEEPPYFTTANMGSAVYADSMKKQKIPVRIMICLEMIGYFSDAKGSQKFPAPLLKLFYPSQGNFIAVVGKMDQISAVRRVKKAMQGSSVLPVFSINAPTFVQGIDFSDHRSYWQAGYDAVMITDTSFYRNPNYHTAKDTADTLDYDKMAMVVQGVYASVLTYDE